MKTKIACVLFTLALTLHAFAHGKIELGPNGGRLIEFGADNPVHAEVILKDGAFVVGLYDEQAKKEISVTSQVLVVTHKEGNKKLSADLKDGKWVIAKPDGKDFWLILQMKDDATAKSKTGRFHYDASVCSECNKVEWLCTCGSN